MKNSSENIRNESEGRKGESVCSVRKGAGLRKKMASEIPFITNVKIEKPSLERFGVWYFKRMKKRRPEPPKEVEIHLLDRKERLSLRKIERMAIFKAAVAGAISAFGSAWANLQAYPYIDKETHVPTTDDYLYYWAFVGGITVLLTLIEIGFIYWDSLRSVYKISQVAKVPLFPDHEKTSKMAFALARAALEIPNPVSSDLNINPNKESSRWKVIISPVVYKMKIAATNFILKLIIRRTMGRAVARVYIEFIAVPASAIWNGAVSWQVLRKARISAIGPSFALHFVNLLLQKYTAFSENAKAGMVRAIGSTVVRSENLHPNLEYLLHILMSRFEIPEMDEIDNTALFIDDLKTLEKEEQEAVLQVLVVAVIIEGRLKPKKRSLLKEAFFAAGYGFFKADIQSLKKAFFIGSPVGFPVVPLHKL